MRLCLFVRRLCILASGLFLFGLAHFSEAQTTVPQPRVVQTINNKQLVELKGNVHPLAQAQFDQGAAEDTQPMNRILLLLQRSPEQEALLRQLLDDQQSKSSPNFHKWVTPEEFGAQFGIAEADLLAVRQWLSSQGFTNINVGPGRSVVEFSGTVGQIRTAFHTDIHQFRVGGTDRLANTLDPQIPAALSPVVNGIVSLHNFPRKSHARIVGQFLRQAGKPGLTPLLTIPLSNRNFYGMGPGDFATIYNSKPLIASGIDGTGQTIAIVGETNINLQDVQKFRSMFGLPANFDASNIILNGEDPGITSPDEEGEADLDVEWSGATAPGATVRFVVSASTPASAGIDLSALYIIEHNLAGVMSESYGACEADLGAAGNAFYNGLWQQAAAQGITVIVSAGDGGSAGCDDFNNEDAATQGLAVSGLASTPYNISLGGTDFDEVNRWTSFWNSSNDSTGTSAKSYIPEIPWNESCAQIGLTGCGASAPSGSLNIVAGSGGQSKFYSKPVWQMGVNGMPNDNHRDQPDVSLLGSPGFNGTGYVYCQSDEALSGNGVCDITNPSALEFGVIGGTSASAPAFAGVMALVNHKQATSSNSAPRQGNANYILYALAKKTGASCASSTTEASTCVFNDVVGGNSVLPAGQHGIGTNSVPCKGGTPNCSVTVASQNGVLVDPSHTTTEAWTVAAGYDMAAGLGSVNINNLATSWSNVSTIPTTTTLTIPQTTGLTHGAENVLVSITVKPNTGTGVAAGNVSLIAALADGSTLGIDQFPLASGAVTAAHTNNLPGGTYNVYAHYSGDGTNAPSDSTPVQVTVSKETSQTFIVIPAIDGSGNPIGNATSLVYGSSYIIRMYVTDKNAAPNPNGPPSPTCDQVNELTCPTGTISLTANGSALDGNSGVFHMNNDGYTRDIAPTLTGGTYSLIASYSGDSSYQPSTSAAHPFTILPATSQTALSLPSYSLVGQPFNITFSTNMTAPGGKAPTGSYKLFDNGAELTGIAVNMNPSGGTPGVNPSIYGNITATLNAVGPHALTLTYSGDANYLTSTSSEQDMLAKYPVTMTMTADSTNVIYGTTVNFTVTVVSNHSTPSLANSTVSFSFGAGSPGTVTIDSSGNQTLTVNASAQMLFSQSINANFLGYPTYADGYANIFINVTIPDFSLVVPQGPLTTAVGQPGSLQLSVTPATSYSSPVSLSCNGNLPVGYSCLVQPSMVNLANGVPSAVTLTLSPPTGAAVVHPALQRKRSTVFLLPFTSNPPWWIALFAGLATALLAVHFANRKKMRAAFVFSVFCFISLGIGCGGGSSMPPPPPPPVGPFATTTTISVGAPKVAQGAQFTVTANVTGTGHPTGSVTFFANGSLLGSTNLTSGTATINTSLPSPGIYSITAQYSGDNNNINSTSSGFPESVTGSTVMQVNGQTENLFHSSSVTVTLQ